MTWYSFRSRWTSAPPSHSCSRASDGPLRQEAAAVAAAAERGGRVVIATHTIALQEQLLGKDVPFLSGVMPTEFSVVLAKGRGNFLCLRRMKLADRSGRELFDTGSQVSQLARIVE